MVLENKQGVSISYNELNVHQERSIGEEKSYKPETTIVGDVNVRVAKGILALAFFLLTYNIFQLASLKPSGYVVDIYSVMPEALTLSLILCFSIATSLLLCRIAKARCASIVLLFLVLLTILIIPYSLGYYSMGRADDMSYIGEYVHIARTGQISGWDIYPASPTIGATISVLTGVEAHIVSFIIPIVFSSLFVVGLYLFGRMFLTNRLYLNILLASSFILYLGPYNFLNVPHALFFAFLPTFLFVILKYINTKTASLSAIVVITSLLLSFTHPFIFFFIFVLLLSLLLLKPITKKLVDGDIRRLRTPLLIQLTCFMAWFIYSGTLLGSFRISIQAYLMNVTEPVMSKTIDKFSISGLDPISFITFILVSYGRYVIPSIVILVFIALCYKTINPATEESRKVRLLITMYSIALFVEVVLVFNPLIAHQVDRMANLLFIVYLQVPLFVISLLYYLKKPSKTFNRLAFKTAVVIAILSMTFGLSLIGAFDSPHIQRENSALTYNEVLGMKWIYGEREGQNMAAPLSQTGRFHALFDDGLRDNYTDVPDHFGYNASASSFIYLIPEFERPLYLVSLTSDQALYEEIPAYKSVNRYTYGDYQRLSFDDSVNSLYSGRDITIFLVY